VLRRPRRSTSSSDPVGLPIVVGGCHRSGTSLVRRILDAHSRIHCGPELGFFRDFHGDYLHDPLQHLRFSIAVRSVLPQDQALDILGGGLLTLHERAAARAGKRRWADKDPSNVLYLADWQRLLGDRWVFVHVVRNPLDTLASIKEARFPLTIPAGLEERLAFYQRYTQAGLDFAARVPQRSYRIVYEHLVSSPEATVRDLMQWLGEPFESRQLVFNDQPHQRGIEDPKVASTRAIHRDAVGRWQEVLTGAETAAILRACAPLWRRIDPTSEAAHLAKWPPV